MPEKSSDEIWQNFALNLQSSVKLEAQNSFDEGTTLFYFDYDSES